MQTWPDRSKHGSTDGSQLSSRPDFPSGWTAGFLKIKFGLSLLKYILQWKKYPQFRLRSLKIMRGGKLLELRGIARLDGYIYGTTMRIPRWPSPAFDRMVANGGLNMGPEVIADKRQMDSVIVGITRRCEYHCEHCYEAENIASQESVPVERWIETVRQLQDLGTSVIILSGGEPLLRFDALLNILESADKRLSDFHIHTSGSGLTLDKARALKDAGLVAAGVSLDYPDSQRYDRFRGRRGAFLSAVSSIGYLREAGIFVYANVCLQKELVNSGDLWMLLSLAKSLGVGAIQLLEPKPCGSYRSTDLHEIYSETERQRVMEFFIEANQSKEFRDYPPVSYLAYYERPENIGCQMGGISHMSIDSAGNVNPCAFVPVSFGNICEEAFITIYRRMRQAMQHPLHGGCPAVLLRNRIAAEKRIAAKARSIPYEIMSDEWKRLFDNEAVKQQPAVSVSRL